MQLLEHHIFPVTIRQTL